MQFLCSMHSKKNIKDHKTPYILLSYIIKIYKDS